MEEFCIRVTNGNTEPALNLCSTFSLCQCPCLLKQAIVDRGRYAPDYDCNKDGNTACFFHHGAQHCVKTGMPK